MTTNDASVRVPTIIKTRGGVKAYMRPYIAADLLGIFELADGCGQGLAGKSVFLLRGNKPVHCYSSETVQSLALRFREYATPALINLVDIDKVQANLAALAEKPFEILPLSSRIQDGLYSLGVRAVGEVMQASDQALLDCSDFGVATVAALRHAITVTDASTPVPTVDVAARRKGIRSYEQEIFPARYAL